MTYTAVERRMRRVKQALAWGALGLVLASGVGLRALLHETNLDRTQGDYRSRMHAIWPVHPPGVPDTEGVGFALDSSLLGHLFTNELDGELPYLVAFPVTARERAPALLLLPGGGYAFRSEKLDGLNLAAWFSERGVAAFVLDYRVDPFRYPIPLRDAQRAMRWLRAHAAEQHIDPERIGVLGTSAGGHLAAVLATEGATGDPDSPDPVERQTSRPSVLIMAQAVVSFEQFVHQGSLRHLLGNSPDPALVQALSVEHRVDAHTPPTFIWTTQTDEFVDYRNSVLFAEALRQHGVDHEFQLFPEGHHGRGLARIERYSSAWPRLCLDWLRRHGFTPDVHARQTGADP